jgi:hypothetical protein
MDILAKDVFTKVLKDAIKNIVFYGIGALVIAFIGNALSFRIFGIILAGLFAFIVLLSLIPFLFSFIAGLVAGISAIVEAARGNKKELNKQGYLWAGTIVQLVENTICLLYVLYLYKAFFG